MALDSLQRMCMTLMCVYKDRLVSSKSEKASFHGKDENFLSQLSWNISCIAFWSIKAAVSGEITISASAMINFLFDCDLALLF